MKLRIRHRRLVATVEIEGRHRCVVVRDDGVWPLRAGTQEPTARCLIEEKPR